MPRIRVGIRIRPDGGDTLQDFIYSTTTERTANVEIVAAGVKNEFSYDSVFSPETSQEQIFSACAEKILYEVLEGYNATIFAYGQTGAGKTYTITGPEVEDFDRRGLCMRSASYLFQSARRIKDANITFKFSAVEIYNDIVVDLLREDTSKSTRLVVLETPTGVVLPSLFIVPLESEEDAYTRLIEANVNRAVAEHQLNRRSSRSHVIYTFYMIRSRLDKNNSSADVMQSKAHLVDLAGSERINKTGSTGGLAKEATYINKSLTFLEQVIIALTKSKPDFVPYRQSKLTFILKDSLGGNCNTYMIACVWPHQKHLWESLSTLRFAARMKCVENHPTRNSLVSKEPASAALLQKIAALKRELAMRDAMQSYYQSDAIPPTASDKVNIKQQAMDYLLSNESAVPLLGLTPQHMSLFVSSLRDVVWEACGGTPDRVEELLCGKVAENIANNTMIPSEEVTEQPLVRNAVNQQRDSHQQQQQQHQEQTQEIDDDSPVNNRSTDSDAFEQYKVGPGAALHENYEDLKRNIRLAKSRQRNLVSYVNEQKLLIDECMQTSETENSEELETQLATAKKDYRTARAELIKCKEQIKELSSLKQRALAAFVRGFEEFSMERA